LKEPDFARWDFKAKYYRQSKLNKKSDTHVTFMVKKYYLFEHNSHKTL